MVMISCYFLVIYTSGSPRTSDSQAVEPSGARWLLLASALRFSAGARLEKEKRPRSMEYLWDIYGISMGYPWDICGISMGYQWDNYGISMEYQWNIYGISMEYRWNIYGISFRNCIELWNMMVFQVFNGEKNEVS